MNTRTLTPGQARQLAVHAQMLNRPQAATPEGMLAAFRQLGCVQLDPLSYIAKSHQLVLRNRTGHASCDGLNRDLDQLLWQDKHVFEYWAHCASMVLTEDYPIHRHRMQTYLKSERASQWMEANKALRNSVLRALKRDGPLPSAYFEDTSEAAWQSGGWTSGRNVNQMLFYLWLGGQLVVSGRKGTGRLWDLAERHWPAWMPQDKLKPDVLEQRAALKALNALGVGTPQQIKLHFIRGRYPTLKASLAALEKAGQVERVKIEGMRGEWVMPADLVPLLDEGGFADASPTAQLLSPFDNLICDRKRTQQLFNFDYTIEIYVPKDKRKFGYYVLPILYGDAQGRALIGRVDAQMDRAANIFRVHNVYAEPDAPMNREAGRAVGRAVEGLAGFLGTNQIIYTRIPEGWKRDIR